jgi:hypothetical protein
MSFLGDVIFGRCHFWAMSFLAQIARFHAVHSANGNANIRDFPEQERVHFSTHACDEARRH